MYSINSRPRNFGRFRECVLSIRQALIDGGTAGIMAPRENDYAQRVATALKAEGIEVKIQVVTRKEPINNISLTYDAFGEIVGTKILPQKDVFSGWLLTLESAMPPPYLPDFLK